MDKKRSVYTGKYSTYKAFRTAALMFDIETPEEKIKEMWSVFKYIMDIKENV